MGRIFDQMATPCVVIDADCIVVAANNAATALLDRPHDELVGAPLSRFWRVQDHERIHRAIRSLGAGGEPAVVDRLRITAHGRDWFVVDVALTPLEFDDDSLFLCELLPVQTDRG